LHQVKGDAVWDGLLICNQDGWDRYPVSPQKRFAMYCIAY